MRRSSVPLEASTISLCEVRGIHVALVSNWPSHLLPLRLRARRADWAQAAPTEAPRDSALHAMPRSCALGGVSIIVQVIIILGQVVLVVQVSIVWVDLDAAGPGPEANAVASFNRPAT